MSPKSDLIQRLRETFKEEAEDHIQQIGSGLLEMEQSAEPKKETRETIYRSAHSLKGAARAVELTDVEEICQAMENVFTLWNKQNIPVADRDYDTLQRAMEVMTNLVEKPNHPSATKVPSIIKQINNLAVQEKTTRRMNIKSVTENPAYSKSVPESKTTGRQDEKSAGPHEAIPPKTALKAKAPKGGNRRFGADTKTAHQPTDSEKEQAPEPLSEKSYDKSRAKAQMIRVPSLRLDELLLKMEGTLSEKMDAESLHDSIEALSQTKVEFNKEWEKRYADIGGDQALSDFPKLQKLIQWTQDNHRQFLSSTIEMVEKSQIHAKSLGSTVNSLLEDTKKISMQPFSSLLEGFPMMIRKIASQEGKKIALFTKGQEVETDKRILDELRTPLTHLLRNSIDHGIEPAEERIKLGKSETGRLTVSISQLDSSRVQLLVEDDGGGIALEKVKSSAVKTGYASREDVDNLEDKDTLNLIFESGISSSTIISDLSGHGLGMAIVREKVEELGGSISVESKEGKGTTFRIILPLTIATFRGIVVESAGSLFVMPASAVVRVTRSDQEGIETIEGRETIKLNGQVVPFLHLEDALGMDRKELPGVRQPYVQILLIRYGEHLAGVAVDRVIREQEVLVKGLGKQLVRVPNISGATVLGTGEVVPILNAADLGKSAEKSAPKHRISEEYKGQSDRAENKSIVVAEDSITSRMLIKNILESAGYSVKTAVDGTEAWSMLRTEQIDLLVSDVEMPRMDGFELTKKIRNSEEFKALPVVLVTALSSREHREKGIDVGANAYIVKSSFDQSNLLEAVKHLI